MGPRRAVPHRENAAGFEDLAVDYQAVMAAAVMFGEPTGWVPGGRQWCWAGTVRPPPASRARGLA